MQQSKLINLLKILPIKELNQFKDYIFSPYFNKNKKIRALYEFLLIQAPAFDHLSLKKQRLYPLLFGQQPFNELQINNVISDLLQLLYGFLAQQNIERQTLLKKFHCLNELIEREEIQHTDRISKSYTQVLEKKSLRNFQYHFHKKQLNEQLVRHRLTTSMRTRDQSLQEHSNSLDLYYFGNKLRIACDMTSRNIVTQANYDCQHLDYLLQCYEDQQQVYQNEPCITVYYKALKMIREGTANTYYDLKNFISEHLSLFPNEELRILYVYLQNFCIRKSNSGQSQYYRELRDLYDIILEKGIIFKNGYLSQWAYKNIVTLGLRMRDYEWTEEVIHRFKKRLLPEEQNNGETYNLAALYYARSEYKKALRQLHNVEFIDTSYHTGAKIIQLKSYYELDETEALYALIEAFKKYVLRNKEIAAYRKKANANFLRVVKKVYQLKINAHRLPTAAFRKKQQSIELLLGQLDPIANKDWVSEVFGVIDSRGR